MAKQNTQSKANQHSQADSKPSGFLNPDSIMKIPRAIWAYVKAFSLIIFSFIVGLFLLIFVAALFADTEEASFGANVAHIPITGVIVTDAPESLFGEVPASSEEIVKLIEKAADDPAIKAILIEINSPGGSPVASDEIALALKRANKTSVAWIRDVGASGGYWVASATDHIVANRMSITGSIGVIASYLDFSGFINRYNVSYERMVAGKYKDVGSPFRELTNEERALFQASLDSLHDEFIDEVASNRNMKRSDVEKLATGMFYIGSDAKKLGLVDELGGYEEALNYIIEVEGIEPNVAKYKPHTGWRSIFDASMQDAAYFTGRGIGDSFLKSSAQNTLSIST